MFSRQGTKKTGELRDDNHDETICMLCSFVFYFVFLIMLYAFISDNERNHRRKLLSMLILICSFTWINIKISDYLSVTRLFLIVRLICLWGEQKEAKSTPVLFTVRTAQRKKKDCIKLCW